MKAKIEVEVFAMGAIDENGMVDCIYRTRDDRQVYGKSHLAHLTPESKQDLETLSELKSLLDKQTDE